MSILFFIVLSACTFKSLTGAYSAANTLRAFGNRPFAYVFGAPEEEKTAEEVAEQTIKEREEEISRKAIEEYIASRKRIDGIVNSRSDKARKGK